MKPEEIPYQRTSKHRILRARPLIIATVYVLAGSIWLAVTDIVAQFLFTNGLTYFWAQFIKGLVYILTTGLLVYWLAGRAHRAAQAEQVQERLDLTERILSAVLGSIGDAVLLIDPSGRTIVNCNQAAEQIFGYEKRELIGKPTEILHIDRAHFEHFGKLSEQTLEQGRVFRSEYTMRHKDGSTFVTANTVSPTHGQIGWKAGVVSIVRDISDRKRAERQVQESLQEKQIMLREIHHRVKNNLSVITSLLNLQADRIETGRQAITALELIRRRIRSMALIHEQLYGSQDFIHVNMRRFVEQMVRSLNASKMSPTGQTDGDEISPEVRYHIDFEDIFLSVNYAIPCSLILNELLTNAGMHAFPQRASGDVHIELKKHLDGRFELSVSDNGCGLPGSDDGKNAELLERLAGRNPQGLGLHIVAALVRQIDAEVKIESDSEHGTRFEMLFSQERPDSFL